jgi:predicted nucleic acid-binding protein
MLAAGERVLVDASVAIKWVAPEPDSDRAAVLLDYRLIVPDLFFPECANILWKKLHVGDLTEDEARIAGQTLEEVDLSVIPAKPHFRRALVIAVALAHPAYDAMYLAVAEAFGLQLVTADQRLIRKMRAPPGAFSHLVVPLSELG